MPAQRSFVDVIHSPWCFIEAPQEAYVRAFEARWQVSIREFNLWEIEDHELGDLPAHIADAIRQLRTVPDPHAFGSGGSLFFLDGQQLDLSPALKWPQVEHILTSRHGGEGRHGS